MEQTATLTAAEVADRLGVHVQTVYKLLRRGDLPHYRVGRAVRFRADAIDALTRGQQ